MSFEVDVIMFLDAVVVEAECHVDAGALPAVVSPIHLLDIVDNNAVGAHVEAHIFPPKELPRIFKVINESCLWEPLSVATRILKELGDSIEAQVKDSFRLKKRHAFAHPFALECLFVLYLEIAAFPSLAVLYKEGDEFPELAEVVALADFFVLLHATVDGEP